MGGSSSTPKTVTLEQEGNGMVKVSEAVARRLVGKPDAPAAQPRNEEQRITLSPKDVDEEIKTLQSQYDKRIKALEKKNEELYHTTTDQFAKAVEEVEKKFVKTTSSPICDDLQQQVMECYNENQKHTLNCSQIVKKYSSCVQLQREDILTKKEECQPCLLAQMARGPCGYKFIESYNCYLDNKDMDECGQLYLEMKQCWAEHPDYGYEKIISRVYDTPGDKGSANTDTKNQNDSNGKVKSSEANMKESERKPA